MNLSMPACTIGQGFCVVLDAIGRASIGWHASKRRDEMTVVPIAVFWLNSFWVVANGLAEAANRHPALVARIVPYG